MRSRDFKMIIDAPLKEFFEREIKPLPEKSARDEVDAWRKQWVGVFERAVQEGLLESSYKNTLKSLLNQSENTELDRLYLLDYVIQYYLEDANTQFNWYHENDMDKCRYELGFYLKKAPYYLFDEEALSKSAEGIFKRYLKEFRLDWFNEKQVMNTSVFLEAIRTPLILGDKLKRFNFLSGQHNKEIIEQNNAELLATFFTYCIKNKLIPPSNTLQFNLDEEIRSFAPLNEVFNDNLIILLYFLRNNITIRLHSLNEFEKSNTIKRLSKAIYHGQFSTLKLCNETTTLFNYSAQEGITENGVLTESQREQIRVANLLKQYEQKLNIAPEVTYETAGDHIMEHNKSRVAFRIGELAYRTIHAHTSLEYAMDNEQIQFSKLGAKGSRQFLSAFRSFLLSSQQKEHPACLYIPQQGECVEIKLSVLKGIIKYLNSLLSNPHKSSYDRYRFNSLIFNIEFKEDKAKCVEAFLEMWTLLQKTNLVKTVKLNYKGLGSEHIAQLKQAIPQTNRIASYLLFQNTQPTNLQIASMEKSYVSLTFKYNAVVSADLEMAWAEMQSIKILKSLPNGASLGKFSPAIEGGLFEEGVVAEYIHDCGNLSREEVEKALLVFSGHYNLFMQGNPTALIDNLEPEGNEIITNLMTAINNRSLVPKDQRPLLNNASKNNLEECFKKSFGL